LGDRMIGSDASGRAASGRLFVIRGICIPRHNGNECTWDWRISSILPHLQKYGFHVRVSDVCIPHDLVQQPDPGMTSRGCGPCNAGFRTVAWVASSTAFPRTWDILRSKSLPVVPEAILGQRSFCSGSLRSRDADTSQNSRNLERLVIRSVRSQFQAASGRLSLCSQA